MKCLISTNAKDEHNIQEWAHYHLLLGFDAVLIWDDFSNDPIRVEDNRVRVVRRHADKEGYMMASVAAAKEEGCDWIMHLDADEYLYLGVGVRLPDFLARHTRPETIVVMFPWLIFGSNRIDTLTPKGSCLRPFTRCAPKTHQYIKPLARVSAIIGVNNPHEYKCCQSYTAQNTLYAPDRTPRHFKPLQPREIKSVSPNTCFIAHYRFQSWDIFRHRKGRARDDTQTHWKLPFSLHDNPPPFFHANSNQHHFPHVLGNYLAWSQEK
jgi:hypothetical protein